MEPKHSGEFLFNHLGDIWKLLSKKDRRILGNFWQGLIQITGDLYTGAHEKDLATSILNIPLLSDSRWNRFTFDDSSFVEIVPSPISGFSYVYSLGDSTIVSIPTLQDNIDRPNLILKENEDYIIKYNFIYFKEEPFSYYEGYFPSGSSFFTSRKLWAKDTFRNKELPYKNFGILIDLYRENSEQYLNILRGLWYAYWTGPKPRNIKIALCLLFNLPVALKPGTVTRRFGDGNKYVTIRESDGVEVNYLIPSGLDYAVNINQEVILFEPLCKGIEVLDKIDNPGFVANDLGRNAIRRYLTQYASLGEGNTDETKALTILEDSLFVAQVDYRVFFSFINLGDVKNFLQDIQPTYDDFILQVLTLFDDDEEKLVLDDDLSGFDLEVDLTLTVDGNPVNDMNDAQFSSYQTVGNENADLDTENFFIKEQTFIEVYDSGMILIDSFEVVL
jgi:hypothetical protein